MVQLIAIKMSFFQVPSSDSASNTVQSVLHSALNFPCSEFLSSNDSNDTVTSSRKRNPFWKEEDDKLLQELALKFHQNWRQIAKFFPGKPKSVVIRRWENKLNPEIKRSAWTEEEDLVLLATLEEVGPVWKEIAKKLPGRPPDMVKNRYYGHIKRLKDIQAKKHSEMFSQVMQLLASEGKVRVLPLCPGLLCQEDIHTALQTARLVQSAQSHKQLC